MTRDEFITHMVETHALGAGDRTFFESVSTADLALIHSTDHESVMSVEKGFANHQHSEFLEVDGMPAFPG